MWEVYDDGDDDQLVICNTLMRSSWWFLLHLFCVLLEIVMWYVKCRKSRLFDSIGASCCSVWVSKLEYSSLMLYHLLQFGVKWISDCLLCAYGEVPKCLHVGFRLKIPFMFDTSLCWIISENWSWQISNTCTHAHGHYWYGWYILFFWTYFRVS